MASNSVEAHTAYHLVPEDWYRAQPEDVAYLPEAFGQDGFVHLTRGMAEVMQAGNRYYLADARSYLLLTVDLNLITSAVRYEDAAERFPHVYGPIDRAAIVAVREVERAEDGTFLAIAEPDTT